jgi:hypothetical protein
MTQMEVKNTTNSLQPDPGATPDTQQAAPDPTLPRLSAADLGDVLAISESTRVYIPEYEINLDRQPMLENWIKSHLEELKQWEELPDNRVDKLTSSLLDAAGFNPFIAQNEETLDRFALSVVQEDGVVQIALIAKVLDDDGNRVVPYVEGPDGETVDPDAVVFALLHAPE